MYSDLKGKTALITGAGKKSGIGFAIAEQLAENGMNIIIADLGNKSDDNPVSTGTTEEMSEIVAHLESTYKVQALAVELDVQDSQTISKMIESIKAKFDGVDVLCNNAGATFGVPSMVSMYDEAAWIKTIDINLHGVFRVSNAVMPLMMGREGAAIINTASRAAKVPPMFNGAYAVAKAGVVMLTKVLAKELAQVGIRVNAICPGQIMTDLERWRFGLEAQAYGGTWEDRAEEMRKTIPLQRLGDPQDVAKMFAYLASDASSYVTGQALNVCGGQLMEL